jgi:hypothetical protein
LIFLAAHPPSNSERLADARLKVVDTEIGSGGRKRPSHLLDYAQARLDELAAANRASHFEPDS